MNAFSGRRRDYVLGNGESRSIPFDWFPGFGSAAIQEYTWIRPQAGFHSVTMLGSRSV